MNKKLLCFGAALGLALVGCAPSGTPSSGKGWPTKLLEKNGYTVPEFKVDKGDKISYKTEKDEESQAEILTITIESENEDLLADYLENDLPSVRGMDVDDSTFWFAYAYEIYGEYTTVYGNDFYETFAFMINQGGDEDYNFNGVYTYALAKIPEEERISSYSDAFPAESLTADFSADFAALVPSFTPASGNKIRYQFDEEEGYASISCFDDGTVGTNSIEDAYLATLEGLHYVIDDSEYEEYGYYASDANETVLIQFFSYEGMFRLYVSEYPTPEPTPEFAAFITEAEGLLDAAGVEKDGGEYSSSYDYAGLYADTNADAALLVSANRVLDVFKEFELFDPEYSSEEATLYGEDDEQYAYAYCYVDWWLVEISAFENEGNVFVQLEFQDQN